MNTYIRLRHYFYQFFLEWKTFSINCRENQNKNFKVCIFLFLENRAVCKIMWENIVETDMAQTTIWRMRIACWITDDTEKYSECVMFIAFPRQQALREHSWMLVIRRATLPVLLLCPLWRAVWEPFVDHSVGNQLPQCVGLLCDECTALPSKYVECTCLIQSVAGVPSLSAFSRFRFILHKKNSIDCL